MTVLITPPSAATIPYIRVLMQSLQTREHAFIITRALPLMLLWYRFMRNARAMIVVSNHAKWMMTFPAYCLGIKIFWIETRLIDRTLRGNIIQFLYRIFSRWVTIIVLSRAIRQQLLDRGVASEHIHVIAPGIALETLGVQKSIFGTLAETKKKRRMGFSVGALSSLEKEKGLEYLLQAFKMARESILDLHLTIVGHGPEKSSLQWLAKKLGVAEHVLFVGWQERTEQWLTSFDLIVAPQLRKEGFGEFLLIAMAYGKPIIATDVGSFPEIVERRKTGIVIEAGNASMLTEAMVNLYHHPEWREEMGKRARERVEEYFSLPRMVNAWDVLLRHER